MCETLYNQENYQDLVDVINNMLNEDGYVLIGTKTFYFGFGGGYYDFENYFNKNSRLVCSVVEKINDGKSIERLIAKISK